MNKNMFLYQEWMAKSLVERATHHQKMMNLFDNGAELEYLSETDFGEKEWTSASGGKKLKLFDDLTWLLRIKPARVKADVPIVNTYCDIRRMTNEESLAYMLYWQQRIDDETSIVQILNVDDNGKATWIAKNPREQIMAGHIYRDFIKE